MSLNSLEQEVQSFSMYTDIERVDVVAKHVTTLRNKIDVAAKQAQEFNDREMLFDQDITEYHQISSLNRSFGPYETLWDTTSKWLLREEELYNGTFTEIDGEEIEGEMDRFSKDINTAHKTVRLQKKNRRFFFTLQRSNLVFFIFFIFFIFFVFFQFLTFFIFFLFLPVYFISISIFLCFSFFFSFHTHIYLSLHVSLFQTVYKTRYGCLCWYC